MSLLGWTNAGTAALLIVAIGFGLVEHGNYLSEKAARAQDSATAQRAVLSAQAADAARTRQIEDEHAVEVAALKEKAFERYLAIAGAPVTTTCAASPAMRALFDGLRARPTTASPAQ
jgi:hypothetical protein